ncbi:MAG: helix-turn-helix transcriptional regulator [Mycoplasmataceae bacterium]|nr:helix-turn-helix transcriptional regulator [Mycoplasmataceae bacterium]
MTDIKKWFGNRVRELRKKKNWSQEDFSFEIDMARCYVAIIEAGKQNIALTNVQKICNGLNVSISEFFKDFK